MGTQVLRPQDCLIERIGVVPALYNRRKNFYGNGIPKTNNHHRKPVVRAEKPDQKKRFNSPPEATVSKRASSVEGLRSTTKPHNNQIGNQLVTGQVTILRRGESLDSLVGSKMKNRMSLKNNDDDLIVCGIDRLGPDPEMVPKQIRISPMAGNCRSGDMYAGSAFSMSPSPRSLPLPSFFNKKEVSKSVDDSATRDLRRLLRLE